MSVKFPKFPKCKAAVLLCAAKHAACKKRTQNAKSSPHCHPHLPSPSPPLATPSSLSHPPLSTSRVYRLRREEWREERRERGEGGGRRHWSVRRLRERDRWWQEGKVCGGGERTPCGVQAGMVVAGVCGRMGTCRPPERREGNEQEGNATPPPPPARHVSLSPNPHTHTHATHTHTTHVTHVMSFSFVLNSHAKMPGPRLHLHCLSPNVSQRPSFQF